MDAALGLKAYLAQFSLNVWVDQRTKYTPGQKFAYWEHIGVKLRIEVKSGPQPARMSASP